MRGTDTRAAVAALLMLTVLIGGCATTNQADGDRHLPLAGASPPPPFAGEAEVVTGTSTPHKQKDAPVETERISDKQMEQAGATHIDQVLQDVPAIQRRR